MNKDDKWVVKAGSSLVSGNHEGVNINFISQLASQIDFLRKSKQEVIIISSFSFLTFAFSVTFSSFLVGIHAS